jgi:MarR family transcriptional regulator, 2-MHQ and catechol-resistance regulon repressor
LKITPYMQNQDEISKLIPPFELLWAGVSFTQAWSTWMTAIEKSIRSFKVNFSQLVVLQALLFSASSLTVTDISRILPLKTASVSPLLDRLYERQLISRRRSRSDRRVVKIDITAQGRELMKEMLPGLNKVMDSVFAQLTEQERNQLIDTCHKITYLSADSLGANKKTLDTNAKLLAGLISRSQKLRQKPLTQSRIRSK